MARRISYQISYELLVSRHHPLPRILVVHTKDAQRIHCIWTHSRIVQLGYSRSGVLLGRETHHGCFQATPTFSIPKEVLGHVFEPPRSFVVKPERSQQFDELIL